MAGIFSIFGILGGAPRRRERARVGVEALEGRVVLDGTMTGGGLLNLQGQAAILGDAVPIKGAPTTSNVGTDQLGLTSPGAAKPSDSQKSHEVAPSLAIPSISAEEQAAELAKAIAGAAVGGNLDRSGLKTVLKSETQSPDQPSQGGEKLKAASAADQKKAANQADETNKPVAAGAIKKPNDPLNQQANGAAQIKQAAAGRLGNQP